MIQLPENAADNAEIYFDSSRDNRAPPYYHILSQAAHLENLQKLTSPGRTHGTPLTAWLRVPLDCYQSHTRSYFPDETHTSIRRIFVPHHAPHTQRVFCGFCGTPLTYWSEDPREESDYMSVTVGSLFGDHQRLLEDLDLLPEESESDEETPAEEQVEVSRSGQPLSSTPSSSVVVPTAGNDPQVSRQYRQGNMGGIPWFEEMVEGSRLGRLLKTRRGMGISDDQSTMMQWEVSEMRHDDSDQEVRAISSSSQSTGKRRQGSQTVRETRSSRRRTESP